MRIIGAGPFQRLANGSHGFKVEVGGIALTQRPGLAQHKKADDSDDGDDDDHHGASDN
jgi:hypothetical protein